jgi:hypothetical protein
MNCFWEKQWDVSFRRHVKQGKIWLKIKFSKQCLVLNLCTKFHVIVSQLQSETHRHYLLFSIGVHITWQINLFKWFKLFKCVCSTQMFFLKRITSCHYIAVFRIFCSHTSAVEYCHRVHVVQRDMIVCTFYEKLLGNPTGCLMKMHLISYKAVYSSLLFVV